MAKYIFHEEKRNAQEKKAEEVSEVRNSSFDLLKMILICQSQFGRVLSMNNLVACAHEKFALSRKGTSFVCHNRLKVFFFVTII